MDLGLTHLVSHSDGTRLKNRQFERALANKRHKWERKLARRRCLALKKIEAHRQLTGESLEMSAFKNVQKAKEQVARIHKKIANRRNDYLHKYTTSLVRNFDTIAIEDLKPKSMMKNKRLSRSIADASRARIKSMLQYKCKWYEKQLILVDPAYTSRTCSVCKHLDGKKPLHIREWTCPQCGTLLDRDINAAQNILNKALLQS